MSPEVIVDYLLNKPEATDDYPFGPQAHVFKIHGKMFALLFKRDAMFGLNLKCDPHEAVQLRDVFPAVVPAYHMNKMHWNTVIVDGTIPVGEIERMIDNSFSLVVKSLKKSIRSGLELRYGKDFLYKSCE